MPAFGSATAALHRPVAPARVGFDDGLLASQAGLRAEVEPDARGLGVAAHAERVLAQLLGEGTPAT